MIRMSPGLYPGAHPSSLHELHIQSFEGAPSTLKFFRKHDSMSAALALRLSSPVSGQTVPIHRAPSSAPPEAVRSQLNRILESDGFIRAKRMRRFLQYIVEETISGRSNRLCEYSIGVSVFGRGECFEPALDPIVRNDARRLRQKLLEYYQRSEAVGSNELLIEVPKGGYVPVFRSSALQSPKTTGNYRLRVQLLRSSDGAEMWSTEIEVVLR